MYKLVHIVKLMLDIHFLVALHPGNAHIAKDTSYMLYDAPAHQESSRKRNVKKSRKFQGALKVVTEKLTCILLWINFFPQYSH